MAIGTETRGKHIDVTVIEFGTGDIHLVGCQMPNTTKQDELWIMQHTPKPIEQWDNKIYKEGNTSDDFPEKPIIMRFNRVESIDQLISILQEMKTTF